MYPGCCPVHRLPRYRAGPSERLIAQVHCAVGSAGAASIERAGADELRCGAASPVVHQGQERIAPLGCGGDPSLPSLPSWSSGHGAGLSGNARARRAAASPRTVLALLVGGGRQKACYSNYK